ncbi:MAG: hypothetical protein KGO23_11920 [Nitrospirota bacterium]|nr:hypothetical protein [Nitrospirota bacterium]
MSGSLACWVGKLRHWAAVLTVAGLYGCSGKVQRLLGHKPPMMHRYAHHYYPESL